MTRIYLRASTWKLGYIRFAFLLNMVALYGISVEDFLIISAPTSRQSQV